MHKILQKLHTVRQNECVALLETELAAANRTPGIGIDGDARRTCEVERGRARDALQRQGQDGDTLSERHGHCGSAR